MATDSELIDALFQEFSDAVNATSFDRLMATFTEDLLWMPPDEPIKQGAEFREYMRVLLEENDIEYEGSYSELRISGDIAHMRGRYREVLRPRAGNEEPVTMGGHWLTLFRKAAGANWKFTHIMFSDF